MISVTSSLASSIPATSVKVTETFSLVSVRWRDLPNEPSMPPAPPVALRRPREMIIQTAMSPALTRSKFSRAVRHAVEAGTDQSPLESTLASANGSPPLGICTTRNTTGCSSPLASIRMARTPSS